MKYNKNYNTLYKNIIQYKINKYNNEIQFVTLYHMNITHDF